MTRSSQRSAPVRGRRQRARRGATTVEYAVLVGILVAVALGAWQFLGQRIRCTLGFASAQISADGQGTCGAAAGPQGAAPAAPSAPIAAP